MGSVGERDLVRVLEVRAVAPAKVAEAAAPLAVAVSASGGLRRLLRGLERLPLQGTPRRMAELSHAQPAELS